LKKTVAFLLVFVVSSVTSSAITYSLLSPSQYEQRIADLKSELAEKNSLLSALQTEKLNLESQISSLQSKIFSLKHQINTEILGIFFSPKGGCENQILHWISRANLSIHILIYSFTLDSIGDALVEAHNRGVTVKVVFEAGQISQYSEYEKLKTAGISVRTDTNPKLMHNKVMIVDGIIVLTGSFNWSNNAENYNDENLIVIKSTYVAKVYEAEFQKIWAESA